MTATNGKFQVGGRKGNPHGRPRGMSGAKVAASLHRAVRTQLSGKIEGIAAIAVELAQSGDPHCVAAVCHLAAVVIAHEPIEKPVKNSDQARRGAEA